MECKCSMAIRQQLQLQVCYAYSNRCCVSHLVQTEIRAKLQYIFEAVSIRMCVGSIAAACTETRKLSFSFSMTGKMEYHRYGYGLTMGMSVCLSIGVNFL